MLATEKINWTHLFLVDCNSCFIPYMHEEQRYMYVKVNLSLMKLYVIFNKKLIALSYRYQWSHSSDNMESCINLTIIFPCRLFLIILITTEQKHFNIKLLKKVSTACMKKTGMLSSKLKNTPVLIQCFTFWVFSFTHNLFGSILVFHEWEKTLSSHITK